MPSCRICKAKDKHQSIRAPFVFGGEEEHNFWRCSQCDAIYLYPIPSKEDEKKFYLKEFEAFMATRAGDHRDWSSAELHKQTNHDQVIRRLPFLQDYLKDGTDLLEVGCSSGFMLDAFSELGVNCFGIEPSGAFSEFLEQSQYTIYNDISEVEPKKFDLIVSFFVFEHIRDPYNFLQQLYNTLEEDGVIVCEIPCANDPLTSLYEIDAFEKFYWSVAHHYYYTPESLRYILEKLGFRYELVPEQRYDLSNHMVWMADGKPGGQGRYSDALGKSVMTTYRDQLIKTWQCDTLFLYIWK